MRYSNNTLHLRKNNLKDLNFSSETLWTQKSETPYLKEVKEKNCQLRILYLLKLSGMKNNKSLFR